MRLAVALHLEDIPNVLALYNLLSSRQVTLDPFLFLYAGTTAKMQCSLLSSSLSNSNVQDMYDAIAKYAFAVRKGSTVAISAQGVPCNGR